MINDNWIAVDWGTTHLRVWLIDYNGNTLEHTTSDQGMNSVSKGQFENVLLNLISQWICDTQKTLVLACGMLGSKQGWTEASYHQTPCSPVTKLTQAPAKDPRISVYICPGIKQLEPSDVMRGEETQIAGFMSINPNFEGTICLPGTHSKWVSINNSLIDSFQTFLTGEIYALLSEQSVLRHSINTKEWDDPAFEKAVMENKEKQIALTSSLFSIRAQSLISGLCPAAANSRLSGVLISNEILAIKALAKDKKIVFIGASKLCQLYQNASALLGFDSEIYLSEEMTLKGLRLAQQQLIGN